VDTIQALKGADHAIGNNEAYGWIHGILTTDDSPQDGTDADNRARVIVVNNLIDTFSNDAFNGAPGPNSLVANNTFTGSEVGVSKAATVRWTVRSTRHHPYQRRCASPTTSSTAPSPATNGSPTSPATSTHRCRSSTDSNSSPAAR
jgi:hypothetical protein